MTENIHPSIFQNDSNNITSNLKNDRTLLSLTNTREEIYGTRDIKTLASPGKYNLTSDDNDLKGSNTRFLFKNLYGETPLTFLFFSKDNINNIQRLIRMIVYKQVQVVIDNQNINDLQIVMRSIFLAYSRHPKLIDDTMPEEERTALLRLYTKEVDRLNQLVINEVVPLVISGLQQYLIYLKDSSSPLRVGPVPEYVSSSGEREYRSITEVLSGNSV